MISFKSRRSRPSLTDASPLTSTRLAAKDAAEAEAEDEPASCSCWSLSSIFSSALGKEKGKVGASCVAEGKCEIRGVLWWA